MTMTEFVARYGVTMTAEATDHNPTMEDKWDADHWACALDGPTGHVMSVTFSKGKGLNGAAPTVAEVLDALGSDSSSVESAKDFEDWASGMGYDIDSRKAERTYKACKRYARSLKRILGPDAYKTLLWDVERL